MSPVKSKFPWRLLILPLLILNIHYVLQLLLKSFTCHLSLFMTRKHCQSLRSSLANIWIHYQSSPLKRVANSFCQQCHHTDVEIFKLKSLWTQVLFLATFHPLAFVRSKESLILFPTCGEVLLCLEMKFGLPESMQLFTRSSSVHHFWIRKNCSSIEVIRYWLRSYKVWSREL